MNDPDIRKLMSTFDSARSLEIEESWLKLKPLGPALLPYFIEYYQTIGRWQGRVALVFYSMKWASDHDEAFQLGVMALKDRATLVRYRACMLLALSLKKAAIPYLKELLDHKDTKTAEDALAAIDAIEHQNHNYFMDRHHSGRILIQESGHVLPEPLDRSSNKKPWWHFW
jgi:hypothetical protein